MVFYAGAGAVGGGGYGCFFSSAAYAVGGGEPERGRDLTFRAGRGNGIENAGDPV